MVPVLKELKVEMCSQAHNASNLQEKNKFSLKVELLPVGERV